MIVSHASLVPMSAVGANGKLITTDDDRLPYVLRIGKGLSPALLKFSRRKPRYRRVGNLFVMGRRVGQ
jgi:hypothetical protein